MHKIKISRKNDKITADIYITVYYGVKIPDLAWEIQQNTIAEVKKKLGINIEEVNIHVQGVSMRKPKEIN